MSEITYSINEEEKKNKYDLLNPSHMPDALLDAFEILSSSGISVGPADIRIHALSVMEFSPL